MTRPIAESREVGSPGALLSLVTFLAQVAPSILEAHYMRHLAARLSAQGQDHQAIFDDKLEAIGLASHPMAVRHFFEGSREAVRHFQAEQKRAAMAESLRIPSDATGHPLEKVASLPRARQTAG